MTIPWIVEKNIVSLIKDSWILSPGHNFNESFWSDIFLSAPKYKNDLDNVYIQYVINMWVTYIHSLGNPHIYPGNPTDRKHRVNLCMHQMTRPMLTNSDNHGVLQNAVTWDPGPQPFEGTHLAEYVWVLQRLAQTTMAWQSLQKGFGMVPISWETLQFWMCTISGVI